jgi:surface antigen
LSATAHRHLTSNQKSTQSWPQWFEDIMAADRYALLMLAALSGCTTLGSGGAKPIAASVEPAEPASVGLLGQLNGGLIGQKLGANFDKSDKTTALEAEYRALEETPAGQKAIWTNPKNNNGGEVTAAQPYRVGSQNCRQYSHTFFVKGVTQTAKGTACRNTDGSWTPLT